MTSQFLLAALVLFGVTVQAAHGTPLVIAHRGASGYLPEHTMPAYELAVQMGTHFIEPDLFLTADGVLVARHDRNLNATTNGGSVNVDSTSFAQLRQLVAKSRGTSGYSVPGNGYYTAEEVFRVPSFTEVLDYLHGLHAADGRIVGVYPEIKTIAGNTAYNLAAADAMIATLADPRYGGLFDGQRNNVYLQSFNDDVIRHLARPENNPFALPVIYLIQDCQAAAAQAASLATIAAGVGSSITTMNAESVQTLQAAGLVVHAYTLTTDQLMAPRSYESILALGVDGIFTNHPDLAVAAVAVPEPRTWVIVGAGLLAAFAQACRGRWAARQHPSERADVVHGPLTWCRRRLVAAAAVGLTATLGGRRPLGAAAPAASRHPFGRPLVFAHRGASGERPEHTLAAYTLAMEQGADYVEPDLRLTKDGVFICLHDATLERTTDVADRSEFAARARPDSKGVPRWPVTDFTLAEIRSLKTRQGQAGRSRDFDGREGIPTFAELIALVRAHNAARGTRVGITPELKNGDADSFLAFVRDRDLEAGGPAGAAVPLHVQSFDLATVLAVRPQLASPCVWLVSKRPDEAKLAELAGRIDGISIAKAALLADHPAAYVSRLHAAGLCVVSWTFADDRFDSKRFDSAVEELAAALAAGVDALFTDFPRSGVAARDRFVAGR